MATTTTAKPVQGGAVERRTSMVKIVGRILCVIVPLIFWFTAMNLDPKAQHTLAITIFMIIGWITEAFDHAVTGLVGCFLYWALKITDFPHAFTGFANDTTWFLVGAFLFGAMATKTGLAK